MINPAELDLKEESVIRVTRVAKVTSRGKNFRFGALVVIGDGNGHVGIGFGKAIDVASAVNKAKENAKKKIFKAPIINSTIPHELNIKYGSVRLLLKPASPGTGIIAGGAVRAVLEQVGVANILSKITGSSNPTNVVKAVEKGLLSLRDPLMVARERGINLKQLFN